MTDTAVLTAPPTVQWQGWRPNMPDGRDRNYSFSRVLGGELLPVEDLPLETAPQAKEVAAHGHRNQGPAGSCVGHAFGLADAVERNVKPRSALWIYSKCRMKRGELSVDLGAYPRDACEILRDAGAPLESKWPYQIEGNTVRNLFVEPSAKADRDAAGRKLFTYHELRNGHEMRSCLADTKNKKGHLFLVGVSVFTNWFTPLVDRFGIVPMPAGQDDGGHMLPVIGHNDRFRESEYAQKCRNAGFPDSAIPERVYKCQNSWDTDVGDGGDYYIPCEYVENPYYAGDWFTLRGFANANR
jgi:C1A family cysteine protease